MDTIEFYASRWPYKASSSSETPRIHQIIKFERTTKLSFTLNPGDSTFYKVTYIS
jgi:hypothetical protein